MRTKTFITTKIVRGFTIAEMLMVIIIIALLAGASGGFYVGTYKKMLVEKPARELVRAVKYAKVLAVERQQPCKVVLDATQKEFYLTVELLNDQAQQVEEVIVRNQYFKPRKLSEGVTFEGIRITPVNPSQTEQPDRQYADGKYVMVFAANGTADATIVQIGDGKRHYTVVVSAATAKATMLFGTAEKVQTETVDLDK